MKWISDKRIKTSLDVYFIECKRINSMNFTKKINNNRRKIKIKKIRIYYQHHLLSIKNISKKLYSSILLSLFVFVLLHL